MAVGYVPAFQRYYGGSGDFSTSPVTVFSSSGSQLSQGPTGVDGRGLYFNPNTGFLESMSYNACCAFGLGSAVGLQHINLDGSGNLVGTNTQLLSAPIAAIGANTQAMVSYDPGSDHLYSKQTGSAVVNVANRTSAAALGTITLNLAGAGVTTGDVNDNFVGTTGVAGSELAIYDFTNHRALVFDLAGNFIGASLLPAIPGGTNNLYGSGYANGQFFVFDDTIGTAGAWRGFNIFAGAAVSTPVPTLSGFGVIVLAAIIGLLAMLGLRRRARI